MERRHFVLGGLGAVLTLSACDLKWLSRVQKEYPNILMLIVDDLNDWVGPLGGHPNTKTPNIDRLAEQGTVFANAHAPAPLCGPSRASVMTGLSPATTGIYGHVRDNDIKAANDKAAQSIFISEYFRNHGYYTAAVGKVFHQNVADGSFDNFGGRVERFGPYPETRMKWHDKRTNTDWGAFPERDDQMPDYDSAQWLAQQLSVKHDKPFFMAGGFLRPHVPWHVPEKWFDMHPIEEIVLPPFLQKDLDDVPDIAKAISKHPMMPTTEWAIENDEWKGMVQAYLASVSFVDSCVGIVLDALDKSEYADDTAVVLWGDHGYSLGEKSKFAKMTLWERATRTPLIIKPPKNQRTTSGKQVTNKPVSLLDLYPTLVKMAGLPENPANQGNDISPLLTNPIQEWEHVALTTYGPNNHAVKTERYRYIRYEDGSEELYDHQQDRDEWHNLADDPNYAEIKKALIKHVPTDPAKWSVVSNYEGNPYFKNLSEQAKIGL
ncbi:sulfatase [Glaciecola sp. SC05]|uniref:sulfatase n=1 Tax=Glaciecola sp. SC05 TaxID=1987355 RepID=UPI003528DE38